jgi:hypothetical protein
MMSNKSDSFTIRSDGGGVRRGCEEQEEEEEEEAEKKAQQRPNNKQMMEDDAEQVMQAAMSQLPDELTAEYRQACKYNSSVMCEC